MTQHTGWKRRLAIAALISGGCLLAAGLLISRPLLPGILLLTSGGLQWLASVDVPWSKHH